MSSSIKIYSYSKCNTCKKAILWLIEQGFNYEVIDIIKSPPSKQLLNKAMNSYKSIKPLFNSSGKSYREIGAENIKAMNISEALEALANDPKLIKRPFLVIDDSNILV